MEIMYKYSEMATRTASLGIQFNTDTYITWDSPGVVLYRQYMLVTETSFPYVSSSRKMFLYTFLLVGCMFI